MSRRARARAEAIAAKRVALEPLPPEEDGDEYEPADDGNAPDWLAAASDSLDDGRAAT